jgi:transporter family protein
MSAALILAFGALVLSGVSDFVYRRAALAGVAAHHLTMVQSWLYGLIVIAYGLGTGTLRLDLPALWGAVAGCFAYTGYYNFARSVQGGAVSIRAAVFRLSFVITVLLAVLVLDEHLGPARLAGLGLALLAVWLLLARPAGAGAARGRQASGAAGGMRVAVATVCVGVASFLYKVGMLAGATPAGLLVVQALTVISISTTMTLRIERRISPSARAWRFGACTAVLLSSAFTLLMEGLLRGEASLVVPINQMGFVVTALLGVTWLGEPIDRRSLAGFGCALASLACLALG